MSEKEFELKLEELRQSHDLELKKLDWEMFMKILELEREREKEHWESLYKVFAPVIELVRRHYGGGERLKP